MQPVTYVTYYALAPFHESGHYLRETNTYNLTTQGTSVFDLVLMCQAPATAVIHPLTGKPAQALLNAYYKSNEG